MLRKKDAREEVTVARLSFGEKDRGKVWKEHMERILNEENKWDQNVKADLVEGPVERVSQEEVVKAMGEMKTGKAAGLSEVSVEMIVGSREIRIGVIEELCQGVLNGRGMPDEWTECCGADFQGERGCNELWAYTGVK